MLCNNSSIFLSERCSYLLQDSINDSWRASIVTSICNLQLGSLKKICKKIADDIKQSARNEPSATTFICAIGAKAQFGMQGAKTDLQHYFEYDLGG